MTIDEALGKFDRVVEAAVNLGRNSSGRANLELKRIAGMWFAKVQLPNLGDFATDTREQHLEAAMALKQLTDKVVDHLRRAEEAAEQEATRAGAARRKVEDLLK